MARSPFRGRSIVFLHRLGKYPRKVVGIGIEIQEFDLRVQLGKAVGDFFLNLLGNQQLTSDTAFTNCRFEVIFSYLFAFFHQYDLRMGTIPTAGTEDLLAHLFRVGNELALQLIELIIIDDGTDPVGDLIPVSGPLTAPDFRGRRSAIDASENGPKWEKWGAETITCYILLYLKMQKKKILGSALKERTRPCR